MAMRDAIRWSPPVALTEAEQRICRRLKRTGRLFCFLREERHRLLNEEFQAKLAEMYAEDYEPGRPPVPPGLLVMVTVLQAYTGVSDADAVHHALFDKRWQMVLDCFGCEDVDGEGKAPFSQGLLAGFRYRLIEADMDRELIRRTVELAKETKGFGYKALRVALDSAPIWGAGRVEDTFNLIGHGLLVCVACAADVEDMTSDEVIAAAGLQIVGNSSVKASLDIDWDDKVAKKQALDRLLEDVERFRGWLASRRVGERRNKPGEREALDTALKQLDRLLTQDIEPDPAGGHRVIDGTAPDRQISTTDPEMRHGRKSKTKTINGYKGHVGYELDLRLVLDAIVTPANLKEYDGGDQMRSNIEYYGPVGEMHIDRGYLPAIWTTDLHRSGIPVYSKPWNGKNRGLFPKSAFRIDLQQREVRCPAGDTAAIPEKADADGGKTVAFSNCATCTIRAQCTTSKTGRTVGLHPNEDLLQQLQRQKQTPEGRARLRLRTGVEHVLAHVLVYQPHKARYVGARKNTFALRRAGVIVNLQAIHAMT
jgi:hypothetical protein